jgi:hypothetical protein
MHQILFDAESFGGNAVPPQSGTWRFGKRPAYSAFAHFYLKKHTNHRQERFRKKNRLTLTCR